MSPTPATVASVANQILERARNASEANETSRDPVAAAERVLAALAHALSRWFGPYGYHAMITRALAEAAETHPVLADVRVRTHIDPQVDGLSDAALAHGKEAVHRASLAIITGLGGLLARLIGEDMALDLLEQSMPAANADTDGSAREESTT